MGNPKNSATKYDRTKTNGETRKERKCENMRKLREKRALERNVEAHGSDEEMQNVEEHIDERNEEHGGDEKMTNVEQMMGDIDIETMIVK